MEMSHFTDMKISGKVAFHEFQYGQTGKVPETCIFLDAGMLVPNPGIQANIYEHCFDF